MRKILLLTLFLYFFCTPCNLISKRKSLRNILLTQVALTYVTASIPFFLKKNEIEPTQKDHLTELHELFKKDSFLKKDFWQKIKIFCSNNKTFTALTALQSIILLYDLHGYFFKKPTIIFCDQSQVNFVNQAPASSHLHITPIDLAFNTKTGVVLYKSIAMYAQKSPYVSTYPEQPSLPASVMSHYQTGQPIYLPRGAKYQKGTVSGPIVIFFNTKKKRWEESLYQFVVYETSA